MLPIILILVNKDYQYSARVSPAGNNRVKFVCITSRARTAAPRPSTETRRLTSPTLASVTSRLTSRRSRQRSRLVTSTNSPAARSDASFAAASAPQSLRHDLTVTSPPSTTNHGAAYLAHLYTMTSTYLYSNFYVTDIPSHGRVWVHVVIIVHRELTCLHKSMPCRWSRCLALFLMQYDVFFAVAVQSSLPRMLFISVISSAFVHLSTTSMHWAMEKYVRKSTIVGTAYIQGEPNWTVPPFILLVTIECSYKIQWFWH